MKIAKIILIKNMKSVRGFVWKKNGGLKIKKSPTNSTVAKIKFKALLEISLVNQYLK